MTYTYVWSYETGKWTVLRRKRVNNERAEGGEAENVTISVHLRVLCEYRYLDKVPARNRFKSESMPTMKGAKKRCAIVLAAIKFSYKTVVRTPTRINGEEDEKKKKGRKEETCVADEKKHRFSVALLKKWRARGYYGHEI
ncbi:unnamed protein product [Lasius platythorax]|uniref:Uncharacterized protein n=1 Tax=Lasius platythorax TaxID=488582 RepID=A0AAV2N5M3_9HYME